MGVSKEKSIKQKEERLFEERCNNNGFLMKIIEYNNSNNIIVEFQDEYKTKVHTSYRHFKNGTVKNNVNRTYETKKNNQGCLMSIVEYNTATDIIVEFHDDRKAKIHTQYTNFKRGNVKNPYYPSVFGVGITGNKYPTWINGKHTKEYDAWQNIFIRCYDEKLKEENPTYKDVTICDEWLCFENFYEWLHSQENFDKWLNGDRWDVDKDILIKGNKLYSHDTCCLVPNRINKLFVKHDSSRGEFPIGVTTTEGGFVARCMNPITGDRDYLGYYYTPEQAFKAYKKHKEDIIKQVAEIEYGKGNITKQCYDAMLKYEVEITD